MRLADNPEFAPIATAPRDGTVILVADEEIGCLPVRWNPTGYNTMWPQDVGIWEAPDRSFTWRDVEGHGPSHWAPYDKKGLN